MSLRARGTGSVAAAVNCDGVVTWFVMRTFAREEVEAEAALAGPGGEEVDEGDGEGGGEADGRDAGEAEGGALGGDDGLADGEEREDVLEAELHEGAVGREGPDVLEEPVEGDQVVPQHGVDGEEC